MRESMLQRALEGINVKRDEGAKEPGSFISQRSS
jgi:hypothetical protein